MSQVDFSLDRKGNWKATAWNDDVREWVTATGKTQEGAAQGLSNAMRAATKRAEAAWRKSSHHISRRRDGT